MTDRPRLQFDDLEMNDEPGGLSVAGSVNRPVFFGEVELEGVSLN